MRLEGQTLEQIAKFLNDGPYTRAKKNGTHKIFKMNPTQVSRFMKDPSYVGVWKYGKNVVDLLDQYDFKPMITVEEFMKINKMDKGEMFKLARRYRSAREKKANLMNGMVICEACGETTVAGITHHQKTGINYFYYRCANKTCSRYGISTRAKVIFDYIYNFLESKPFSSITSYEHYKKEIKRVSEERLKSERDSLLSLQKQFGDVETRISNMKDYLYGEDMQLRDRAKRDLVTEEEEMVRLEKIIEEKKTIVNMGKSGILTYEEFIELMDNMPKILHSLGKTEDMDFLIRKIFLNFTVSSKEVVSRTLCAPFDELYEANFSECRGAEN
jgi:hypothetical protein